MCIDNQRDNLGEWGHQSLLPGENLHGRGEGRINGLKSTDGTSENDWKILNVSLFGDF